MLIAGGGLAGALAALALARARPEVPVLLVEEGDGFGGCHPLLFLGHDVEEADRWLAEPLIGPRWPGYYVAFPGRSRNLRTGCAVIRPAEIDRLVRQTLRPDQYRLGTRVVAVREDELILQGGERIKAEGAVDARGPANLSMLDLGWHAFLGRDYRLAGPHGVDRPVLVDATGGEAADTRFVRCTPLAEDRMRVEHVALSRTADVPGDAGERLGAYLALRGWTPVAIEREAAGAHPLPIGGDFAAFWRVGGARVAKLGLRGGLFHPATGHSLPDALRTATMLTEQRDFSGAALHDLFERHAAALWRKRDFYRDFNARLFAAPPADRGAFLQRFFDLDPGAIARFHAGRSTLLDKRRIGRA